MHCLFVAVGEPHITAQRISKGAKGLILIQPAPVVIQDVANNIAAAVMLRVVGGFIIRGPNEVISMGTVSGNEHCSRRREAGNAVDGEIFDIALSNGEGEVTRFCQEVVLGTSLARKIPSKFLSLEPITLNIKIIA